jgi:ferritin-like metal-binding protein YciE
MNLDSLTKLYVHELKDLYSAEKQLVEALPKMVAAASHKDLKKALKDHLAVTRRQVQRLDKVFARTDFSPRGHKCEGMAGLIKEGASLLKEESEPDVLDAAIIGAAQRVEHYEMAVYGTLRTYARALGHEEQATLLQQNLSEEKAADEKLTRIAERRVNPKGEGGRAAVARRRRKKAASGRARKAAAGRKKTATRAAASRSKAMAKRKTAAKRRRA